MYPKTYYAETRRERSDQSALKAASSAQVVIVGGGYAGLATALGLAERGVHDVLLLDAHEIGFGASGRNGGFVFAGYSLGEQALIERMGADTARWMYGLTVAAMKLIRARIDTYEIDCQPIDSGVLWANWFNDPQVLQSRQKLLCDHFGVDWPLLPEAALREMLLTDRYHGALREPDAFHVHPLDLALGLARAANSLGVRVHSSTPVLKIERNGARWRIGTLGHQIEAAQVVLAGGGYLNRIQPLLYGSQLPIATYVAVTEPLGERLQSAIRTNAAIYDSRFAFDYYRPLSDSRLLWGGRISILERSPAAVARVLKRDIARVYPQLADVKIDYAWNGLMSYARHEMPQVGRLDDGLWYAQGFGGHGVATTTAIGELLAKAIAEDDPSWRRFEPFGLQPTFRPFGLLGAEALYWLLQRKDAWRARKSRASVVCHK